MSKPKPISKKLPLIYQLHEVDRVIFMFVIGALSERPTANPMDLVDCALNELEIEEEDYKSVSAKLQFKLKYQLYKKLKRNVS